MLRQEKKQSSPAIFSNQPSANSEAWRTTALINMSQPCLSSLPSWQTEHHSMHEDDEMVVEVQPTETMQLNSDCETIGNFAILGRKDSGIGVPIGCEPQSEPITPINEYCSPDCDLGFPNRNWIPVELKPSTAPSSAKLTIVLAENIASSDWIDQIEAGEAIKQKRDQTIKTRTSPGYKTTFLHLPNHCERRATTREGTPSAMSTCTAVNVAAVPDTLSKRWKKRGDDAVLAVISAMYAKFLIVLGLAFPMTEVISNHVTSSSYLGFYLYLYFGCIAYFLYVFITLVRNKANKNRRSFCGTKQSMVEFKERDDFLDEVTHHPRSYSDPTWNKPTHHGSFYLRIGAVSFGVGSMIYSGLEFAQYFEIDAGSYCDNILMAVTPATRMVFTFIQMYFIFLNAKMGVCKPKAIAYFGLMHMVATNLCVWLNVIIEETKHEILQFHHNVSSHGHGHGIKTTTAKYITTEDAAHAEALVDPKDILQSNQAIFSRSLLDECKRSEVMGHLVQDASPLLFPCAIEYSLICAAILYVMWKNVAAGGLDEDRRYSTNSSAGGRRSRHHYSVDCAKANKGLFAGIFVLVLTIISLILFFALINNPEYRAMAIMEVGAARFVLFCMAFVATIIGIIQVRELRYDSSRHFDLDDVLLIFGQIGLMAYNIFTVIAGYYTMNEDEDGALVLLSALAALFQAVTQTLFILDASRRNTYSVDQQTRKPGREVVTFLLVCNFAMWTVNTLEKSRADVNPVQLQFYGLWPWIIIMNVCMPLAIFYRFHSTVVLCEIWKRCYKAKPDYM